MKKIFLTMTVASTLVSSSAFGMNKIYGKVSLEGGLGISGESFMPKDGVDKSFAWGVSIEGGYNITDALSFGLSIGYIRNGFKTRDTSLHNMYSYSPITSNFSGDFFDVLTKQVSEGPKAGRSALLSEGYTIPANTYVDVNFPKIEHSKNNNGSVVLKFTDVVDPIRIVNRSNIRNFLNLTEGATSALDPSKNYVVRLKQRLDGNNIEEKVDKIDDNAKYVTFEKVREALNHYNVTIDFQTTSIPVVLNLRYRFSELGSVKFFLEGGVGLAFNNVVIEQKADSKLMFEKLNNPENKDEVNKWKNGISKLTLVPGEGSDSESLAAATEFANTKVIIGPPSGVRKTNFGPGAKGMIVYKGLAGLHSVASSGLNEVSDVAKLFLSGTEDEFNKALTVKHEYKTQVQPTAKIGVGVEYEINSKIGVYANLNFSYLGNLKDLKLKNSQYASSIFKKGDQTEKNEDIKYMSKKNTYLLNANLAAGIRVSF